MTEGTHYFGDGHDHGEPKLAAADEALGALREEIGPPSEADLAAVAEAWPEPEHDDGPVAEEATPPEPETDEDQFPLFEFQVALRLNVKAQDMQDAVEQFIEQLNAAGVRQWIYDVFSEETGLNGIRMFTGYGVEVTGEVAEAAVAAAASPVPTGPPASTQVTDDDLLALATKLNEG